MPKRKRKRSPAVSTFVSAVRKGDVAWVQSQETRTRSFSACDKVSRAFAECHPPGMLTALYRCGFRIEYEGDRHHIATPSHACHGHIFPDHVLKEDVTDDLGYSPLLCALDKHAYAYAFRVLKARPDEKQWLEYHPVYYTADLRNLLRLANEQFVEYTAKVVDEVAVHLPVECVPELVAQYVGGMDPRPFRCPAG